MKVSLCLTVLNEAAGIGELLDSIRSQTRIPDEIVIVDGGSVDGTVERIRLQAGDLPLRVETRPGSTISAGRNAAIRLTDGEIIAVTDCGVRLSADWLAELVKPIEQRLADVTAGFFVPDPKSTFEVAMGATVLPAVEDIDPDTFLPSSRSIAFLRGVWDAVGGYPEWLDYCEDLLFDFEFRRAGFRQAWAPKAIVHFRPRSTLKAYWLQYYRYARGDGKADLWRQRHGVRYLTYFLLVPGLLSLSRRFPPNLLLLAIAGWLYLRSPLRRYRRTTARWSLARRLSGVAWVPIIRLVGDVAKMAGYPVGVFWRLRRGSPRL